MESQSPLLYELRLTYKKYTRLRGWKRANIGTQSIEIRGATRGSVESRETSLSILKNCTKLCPPFLSPDIFALVFQTQRLEDDSWDHLIRELKQLNEIYFLFSLFILYFEENGVNNEIWLSVYYTHTHTHRLYFHHLFVNIEFVICLEQILFILKYT